MQNIKSFDTKPYMTIGIIVVNIIVFVLMSLSGSTLDAQYMAAHGAMYPEYNHKYSLLSADALIKASVCYNYPHKCSHQTKYRPGGACRYRKVIIIKHNDVR